jgi:hypothetical protein
MKEIKKIQIPNIRKQKSPGLVINNFFTLMTIALVSIALLWWAYYIRPGQIAQEKKEQDYKTYQEQKKLEYEQREAQIKLSQKLNNIKETNATH